MQIPIFQVDAFTEQLFGGNPAAVMPLESWLPDATLQSLAAENNLSETAFIIGGNGHYALRWFTPEVEVDLCGHATLAAAHVLYRHLDEAGQALRFDTRSGELVVERAGEQLVMDFPAATLQARDCPKAVASALGAAPDEAFVTDTASPTWLLVYAREADVAALAPDFPALAAATERCVIVTGPGEDAATHFVSRFFGPPVGIDEDPVTGSAHCALAPYWAQRLETDRLRARQISRRGGLVDCQVKSGRVLLQGSARTFMAGTATLD